jgi:hypothetical protein
MAITILCPAGTVTGVRRQPLLSFVHLDGRFLYSLMICIRRFSFWGLLGAIGSRWVVAASFLYTLCVVLRLKIVV